MSARIGIELAPSVCRIVELDAPLSRARHGTPLPRVQSFATLLRSDRATAEAFGALRRRHARVVVWDVPGGHRRVIVADGAYDRMRAEALTSVVRGSGLPVRATLSDIAPAASVEQGSRRRAVLVATADAAGVSAALGPLVKAGIKIDAVLTPAAALWSLARLRRAIDQRDDPPGDEAFVVLEEGVGAAALIHGGAMLAARTLPWGFVDASSGRRLLRPRQEVATRLAGDLAEFLSASRRDPAGLSQISVCGAMPDLRSMTAQLVERLDVEVEPLDSMFGINPRLPDQQFSERVAEMRLAWAAAADERPSLDLFRARRTGAGRKYRSRVAIAAGLVAGLGVGWLVQQRWGPVAARPRPTFTPGRPAPPPLAIAQAPVAAPAPVAAAIAPTADSIAVPGLLRAEEPAAAPPPPEPAPLDVPRRPEPVPATRPSRPAETPLAFDANLGTILFGSERRLAIVDGRIVGEGDEVRGARVVEISQNAVLLRDAQGRLRRLTGSR